MFLKGLLLFIIIGWFFRLFYRVTLNINFFRKPMKKLLLAASAVALLAAGCTGKNGAAATAGADTTKIAASAGVAYFNIDTLINKYDMYLDMRSAYEEKAKKAETEVTTKGRALERNVRDYQDKVQKGLVTRAQAQEIEENLNRQQQAFVQHRDQVMSELGEEEQVLLNQIHHSITEYLKEYNKDYRYGIILSTSTSGPIFNADPKLDITISILEGLNKQYASNKGKTNKNALPAPDKKEETK